MSREVWRRARKGALALAMIAGCVTPLYAKVKKPTAVAANTPQVTFIGFSADGNTGTVYVDLTQPAEATRQDGPNQVRFVMAGVVVLGENNKRPLLTEAFGTPIKQVRIVPGETGATLELQLIGKPSVTHRLIRGEGSARLSVTATPAAKDDGAT